jgi:hypothetical protein
VNVVVVVFLSCVAVLAVLISGVKGALRIRDDYVLELATALSAGCAMVLGTEVRESLRVEGVRVVLTCGAYLFGFLMLKNAPRSIGSRLPGRS